MISFSKPTIGKEETDAVNRVLKSGWLAAGKETELFEKEFAKYVGVKYAIFTNSGTSALNMAYKMVKEKGIDGIIYPRNTYCATYAAAKELDLMAIPKRVIGVNGIFVNVNVHYGGVLDKNLCVIEDSAHRIEPNDPLVGTIRCYSFQATKNMTTGSGGMFVTNERSIYEKARLYWRDGLSKSTYQRARGGYLYDVVAMAGGYDGNDISAAIGRAQLKKLPAFTKGRNAICKQYNDAFGQEWAGNHLYEYFVSSEKEVKDLIGYMSKNGVQCSYHYPNNNWLGVSLPIYPLLKDDEVEYIIKKVKEWRNNG